MKLEVVIEKTQNNLYNIQNFDLELFRFFKTSVATEVIPFKREWKYQPKIAAAEIYNEPQLDWLILELNGLYSIQQFTDLRNLTVLKNRQDVFNFRKKNDIT